MEDRTAELLAEIANAEAKKAAAEDELNALRLKNVEKLTAEQEALRRGAFKNRANKSRQFVSAETAHNTAENTAAPKNHIAKAIMEEAKEGRTILYYSVDGICDVQLNSIINELHELNYDVDFSIDDNLLTIKW